jgi:hypothetical protein
MAAVALAAVVLLTGPAAVGGAPPLRLPIEQQVPVLLKILTFDQALDRTSIDTITVAVIWKQGDRYSREAAEAVHRAFAAYTTKRVAGRALHVLSLEMSGEEEVRRRLREAGAGVVYLAPGLDAPADAEPVTRLARELGIVTMAGLEDTVRAGASVAVRPSVTSPILINLAASLEEGAHFDARLLSLTEVEVIR